MQLGVTKVTLENRWLMAAIEGSRGWIKADAGLQSVSSPPRNWHEAAIP